MIRLKTMLSLPISVAALAGCTPGDEGAAAASPAHAVIDGGDSRLREDFNRHEGAVRLLFVVDPACPGCLRGMDDMNRDLLATTDDPRLRTFVVHVPVIGATEEDVAPSMKLLQNPHVEHYWDGTGRFGWRLADKLQLHGDDERVYAWDVWLLYGPEAVWEEGGPPAPRLLMHQLWQLQDREDIPFLDSEVFAKEARELLDTLPPATPTPE